MSQLRLLDVEAGLPSTDGLAQRAAEFCGLLEKRLWDLDELVEACRG